MALVSPTKISDLEHLELLADILEIGFRGYLKNPKPEVKENLDFLAASYEELKAKIDTYDYTADDKKYWEMEEFWRKIRANPLSPG